jgi:hypothetical protein
MTTYVPTTHEIRDTFTTEIAAANGRVTEAIEHQECLFMRSVFSDTWHVRPGDRLQCGVALRVTAAEVRVHPYVYRQVCRNGAILAQVLDTQALDRLPAPAPDEDLARVMADLTAAVQTCCTPEMFAEAKEQVYATLDVQASQVIMLMPSLMRINPELAAQLLAQITQRFTAERDRSQFGLMNAVTSLARDTRDQELRWQLEELGGRVPALRLPVTQAPSEALALRT